MLRTKSAFAEVLQTSLSSRTVFVKCVPAPITFFERRAVLRSVQKLSHETVETFRQLEDNSSFVVVTTKPGTAQGLVNDSPITRVIIHHDPNAAAAPDSAAWGAEYDIRGAITTPINPIAPSKALKATPAFADLGLSHKTITLHMFAANKSYNHREAVRRNPLHGRWPSNDDRETFTSAALHKSVPSGVMAPALKDWHTANQLYRDSVSFTDEGSEGAAATLLGKKRHTPREVYLLERIRARWNAEGMPDVMKSLAAFATDSSRSPSPALNPLSGVSTRNRGFRKAPGGVPGGVYSWSLGEPPAEPPRYTATNNPFIDMTSSLGKPSTPPETTTKADEMKPEK